MPLSVLCVCDEGYNPFGANENGDIRHTHKIYERKGIRLMAQFYSTSAAVAASNFHHDETSRRLKSLVVIYLVFSSKRCSTHELNATSMRDILLFSQDIRLLSSCPVRIGAVECLPSTTPDSIRIQTDV